MLTDYLQKAIGDLEALIELTSLDIGDIKNARHDSMFGRIKKKEDTLAAFEKRKALIDREIASLIEANPGKELAELLDEESGAMLKELREKLEKLQSINRYYARFVITVGEFYNSMFEEMLPTESDGYSGKSTKVASLIELRV